MDSDSRSLSFVEHMIFILSTARSDMYIPFHGSHRAVTGTDRDCTASTEYFFKIRSSLTTQFIVATYMVFFSLRNNIHVVLVHWNIHVFNYFLSHFETES